MNRLKVIEDVVAHLQKQGRKAEISIGGRTRCCYRTPDGCKCGIGGLIPDELYDSTIELKVASTLFCSYSTGKELRLRDFFIEKYGEMEFGDGAFLNSVQNSLHDLCRNEHFPPTLEYAKLELKVYL